MRKQRREKTENKEEEKERRGENRNKGGIKHLHNIDTRCYCAHMFLSSDSQCGDNVSVSKRMCQN